MLLLKKCYPGCENNESLKFEIDSSIYFSIENKKGKVRVVQSSLTIEFGSKCPKCGEPTIIMIE